MAATMRNSSGHLPTESHQKACMDQIEINIGLLYLLCAIWPKSHVLENEHSDFLRRASTVVKNDGNTVKDEPLELG